MMLTLCAQVFARSYGFPCVGLRYFNVFGRRQDPDGAYASITKPGEYRGNPKGKDSYLSGTLSISFRFGKKDPESFFKPRLKKRNPVVE